jgi:hypothetical protein
MLFLRELCLKKAQIAPQVLKLRQDQNADLRTRRISVTIPTITKDRLIRLITFERIARCNPARTPK